MNAELASVVAAVAPGQELLAAESEAKRHEGDFVLCGRGMSMLPHFPPGSVLVVHPTSYFMLRPGMPVVYSVRGRDVAHLLVERLPGGWRAQGVNNLEPDLELVTPENLVGVVRRVFVPVDAAAADRRWVTLTPPDSAVRIALVRSGPEAGARGYEQRE